MATVRGHLPFLILKTILSSRCWSLAWLMDFKCAVGWGSKDIQFRKRAGDWAFSMLGMHFSRYQCPAWQERKKNKIKKILHKL